MDLSVMDIGVFALFYGVVIAVSLYKSRQEKNSVDYFLAGRGLPWWLIGLSILAANISTEQFVGMAGQGAGTVGLAVSAWQLTGSVGIVIIAFTFLPRFLRSGIYTMPEYLERRYNPECRWFLTVISLFAYVFTKISVALFAGAILIKAVLGWDPIVSAVILVLATGVYTVAGGLAAVIYTDMVQASCFKREPCMPYTAECTFHKRGCDIC